MSSSNKELTWRNLSRFLGISERHVHFLRQQKDAPESRDPAQWRAWLDARGTVKESSEMAQLKTRLVAEQGRREAAVASLKELELRMATESLVPESDLIARIREILIPLRRLLDSMPRGVSNLANPKEPNVAEVAIRKYLDERIFSEIVRILKNLDEEESKQGGK